ncbi:MAG: hypothetical protein QW478_00630 [Candidatus Micrarchaeaceae archaeon]
MYIINEFNDTIISPLQCKEILECLIHTIIYIRNGATKFQNVNLEFVNITYIKTQYDVYSIINSLKLKDNKNIISVIFYDNDLTLDSWIIKFNIDYKKTTIDKMLEEKITKAIFFIINISQKLKEFNKFEISLF